MLGIDLQPADGQRADLDMEHNNSAQISLVRSVMATLVCKGGWKTWPSWDLGRQGCELGAQLAVFAKSTLLQM